MARRKKQNDTGSFVIIVIIAVVIIFSIATPVLLFFGWLVNYLKFKRVKSTIKNDYADFWLNVEEKKTFSAASKELLIAIDEVKKVERLALENNISRNKDGSFSARSNLGKEIRATLEHYKPIITVKKSVYTNLRKKPQARWNDFSLMYQKAKAFQYALVGWIFLIVFFPVYEKILNSTEFFQNSEMTTWFILFICAVISLIVYVLSGQKFKYKTEQYSPYPPEVTLKNLNNY